MFIYNENKIKKIQRIRSNHGREFEKASFNEFCQTKDIFHEFSVLLTPQQNGIVERKNKTIQEMTRVMIHVKSLPLCF